MSIKHQIELNELRGRIEKLEIQMNVMDKTPRTVAGIPDPNPIAVEFKPERKKPGPKPKYKAGDVA